jgi:hypothetical protein
MHKDDRELLELAAKAAGYEYAKHGGYIVVDGIPGNWNPLTNDGDALRLAVALDIEVYQGDNDGPAAIAGYWGKPERRDVTRMFCIEPLEADPYAATRRAVVRAAAEIGRSME